MSWCERDPGLSKKEQYRYLRNDSWCWDSNYSLRSITCGNHITVSSLKECSCRKCRITSHRKLLPEVPYHFLQNAAVWSAVSPPTQCCCLKCLSPPTERCCLKCRFASHHGANLPVIVFLHNTKQTCIQRDCFGRLGSECHSEPTAATVVSLFALKTVNMQIWGWVWSLAVRDVASYINQWCFKTGKHIETSAG